MKKILLILYLVAAGQVECFATLKASDFIIWNNDTLFLDKSPLEQLPEVYEKIREKEKVVNSGCWNGFVAEWILEDSILYLKNLYSCSTGKIINKRLERILRLIPNWGVYYWNGELYNFFHDYYFELNNDKMKK